MRKRLLLFMGGLAAATAALPAYAQGMAEGPGYWRHGWNWGYGHMMFGGLMMLLFWGGLILVIVLAVRWLGGSPGPELRAPGSKTPLEILQERFARGEIDKQEFDERKRLLSD